MKYSCCTCHVFVFNPFGSTLYIEGHLIVAMAASDLFSKTYIFTLLSMFPACIYDNIYVYAYTVCFMFVPGLRKKEAYFSNIRHEPSYHIIIYFYSL